MILNVVSPDRKVQAVVPIKAMLEVMQYGTILEAQDHYSALLKK